MDTFPAATGARISSYLSRLNPVPAFPAYTGPFKVGTVDVEIPVDEIPSPVGRPENAKDIHTVLFRVFYPAVDGGERGITWLPTPQRHYVSAYTRFMGVGNLVADILSWLPRHLYYASIPVHKNAGMRLAKGGRWPTMIFSHGLGGSRNSYSYIAGSLASHGLVVFCPEHRDGSAVASFVRIPGERSPGGRNFVPYERIDHDTTPEIFAAREAQLRIRLWEMGLVHEAALGMHAGREFTNLNTSTPSLALFVDQLHVEEPGSIIFAGHSFGATTVNQLLKSTYYANHPAVAGMQNPLFAPADDSSIRRQVTESTVTMLLDMWCLPLKAPNSAPLYNLPLPAYADVPSAPGGTVLLAVESEAFYKWSAHLDVTARLLSPDPSAGLVSSSAFERRSSGRRLAEPNFFYVQGSAHLSQSDFGILFPWLTRRMFNAPEPERPLRLNLRAQLQLLRANNIPIERTHAVDLVDGAHVDKSAVEGDLSQGLANDDAIFDRSNSGAVRYWHWIDIIGLGERREEPEDTSEEELQEGEQRMQAELDPGEQSPASALAVITLLKNEG